jgi:hemerythrin-like domain-containing protein
MKNPVYILQEEHQLLTGAIEKARQIQNIQDNDLYHTLMHDVILFFRNFNEICHFPKEDKILFPLLQGRTQKITPVFVDEMCNNHEDLEQFISEIVDAHVLYDYRTVRLAMHKYLQELEEQIETEERELLSIADALLSIEESETAYYEFEKHDARHGVITTIKNSYHKIAGHSA